jgi:hypothetical protein
MKITCQAITGEKTNIDASTPLAALGNFYAAFNHRNFELMQSNWLQSEEASMSNPLGGIKRGWEEIKAVYEKLFRGPATVYVEFYDYSVHMTETLFLAVGRERGYLKTGAEKLDLAIRTTRMYRLQEQQWKQIHHHGSMDRPELLSRYQAIVLHK